MRVAVGVLDPLDTKLEPKVPARFARAPTVGDALTALLAVHLAGRHGQHRAAEQPPLSPARSAEGGKPPPISLALPAYTHTHAQERGLADGR